MGTLFGGGRSPGNKPLVYSGLNISTSQWNMPIALFWGQRRLSTNAIDYDGFKKHKQKAKGKGGGGKGGSSYTYSADVLLGLCEGEIDSIARAWPTGSTTSTKSLAELNMTLFKGTATQAPWSYWNTKYPTTARSYARTAYLGAPDLDLGSSATIPDNAFECVRAAGFGWTHSTAGWINPSTHVQYTAIDCLLSDVITDFLTNAQYGMGFADDDLGPIDQFASYQRAQGLFFSPLINAQTKATDVINRWAKLANSWIYWSGTQLQFVPLGDVAVSGNGVSYVPDLDVAYDLQLSDLVAGEGEPPVQITRKDPADCYNTTRLSIVDRTMGYVDNPFEYADDQLVDLHGRRDNTSVDGSDICDPAVARIVVQLLGKRAAYIRNTYKFRTSDRFMLALPGSILTIPLNYTGQRARVRVKSIEENDDGVLQFECEEFPGTVGVYTAAPTVAAPVTPSLPNVFASPPAINTPAVFELPAAVTGGTAKLIAAASGSGNWGGCTVYLSFDGVAYSKIGAITGAASQGVLTANLAAFGGVNPDSAHTLSVDCGQSEAVPVSVTHADADALRTLALIAAQPTLSGGALVMPTSGELLAFGDVAATGTYSADLTYLQRGQYGSSAGSHAAGQQFTLLDVLGTDGSTITFDLPAQYIGQTLHLKFASYNLFGLMEQDLSLVSEYLYTPSGAGFGSAGSGLPVTPTGLAGLAGPSRAALQWNANDSIDNVTTYRLSRAAGTGAAFSSASVIWTGLALNYVDTTTGPSTGYTYFLEALNAVGASTPTAGEDVTTGVGSLTEGSFVFNETPSGAADGSNVTFGLAHAPTAGNLILSVGGIVQVPGTNYTLSGDTITMTTAPASGAVLLATYMTA